MSWVLGGHQLGLLAGRLVIDSRDGDEERASRAPVCHPFLFGLYGQTCSWDQFVTCDEVKVELFDRNGWHI